MAEFLSITHHHYSSNFVDHCSEAATKAMTIFPADDQGITKAIVKSNDYGNGPIKYPLWFGGTSSALAALFSHPLDLGMYLIQMQACCY